MNSYDYFLYVLLTPHWQLALGLELHAYFLFFQKVIQIHMKSISHKIIEFSHEIRLILGSWFFRWTLWGPITWNGLTTVGVWYKVGVKHLCNLSLWTQAKGLQKLMFQDLEEGWTVHSAASGTIVSILEKRSFLFPFSVP